MSWFSAWLAEHPMGYVVLVLVLVSIRPVGSWLIRIFDGGIK